MSASPAQKPRPMLEEALDYLKLKLPIFPVCSPAFGSHVHWDKDLKKDVPCDKPGKRPLVNWLNFQDVCPNEGQVRTWWKRWPDANIGMATGKLADIVVLDVDGSEAQKIVLERGGIDQTPMAWTGKIGGAHYWFCYPGEHARNFARKLPGVDFRGDGGYVLVPPSLHATGNRYRWNLDTLGFGYAECPAWLTELLSGAGVQPSDGERVDTESLDRDTILKGIPEGKRDDTLYKYACKLRGDDVPIEEARTLLAEAARYCIPPFDIEAAIGKVNRVYDVFPPGREDIQLDIDVGPAGAQATPAEPVAPMAYPSMSLRELLNYAEEEQREIVEGLLYAGQCHWLYGGPGTGKTLLALGASLSIAAGIPFAGRSVIQGTALYINEDAAHGRLAQYAGEIADEADITIDSTPFFVNKIRGLRVVTPEAIDAVKALVLKHEPILIVLDSSERLSPSENYNAKEFDGMIRLITWLIDRGICVIVIDHTNKKLSTLKKEEQGDVNLLDLLIGGRHKGAIADVAIYLDGGFGRGAVHLKWAKERNRPRPPMAITYRNGVFNIDQKSPEIETANEGKVIGWCNREAGFRWVTKEEIAFGADIKLRSLERVLRELVAKKLLFSEEQPSPKGGHRKVFAVDRMAPRAV